jgi:predicted nucleic acid-binding protein
MPGSFIDTNILVYFASSNEAKADRAEQIIDQGGTISVQVLNELVNVALRKLGLSWGETRALLAAVRGLLSVQPVTIDVHETGLYLAERYQLSLYDAMIAAAALHADCDTLWSEDMQDGLVIDGRLRVVNPFRVNGVQQSGAVWIDSEGESRLTREAMADLDVGNVIAHQAIEVWASKLAEI